MREFNTKYAIRTDLASETLSFADKKDTLDGVISHTKIQDGIEIQQIEITNANGEKLCGKPKGTYITIETGQIWNASKEQFDKTANVIADVLRELFPKEGACLLCGMGNSELTADALGPMTAKNFIVTRHIKISDREMFDSLQLRETLCIIPGVTAKTGFEAAGSIKGVSDAFSPDFAVVVDALASRKLSRLGTTVQICSTGISPGAGVGNRRQAINSELLGIPVFAIGIPTMVEAQTLALDILQDAVQSSGDTSKLHDAEQLLSQNPSAFFVTPKDTDHIIKDTSKLLGYALNLALHKNLTVSECDEFLS